jgi:hypothetical protein
MGVSVQRRLEAKSQMESLENSGVTAASFRAASIRAELAGKRAFPCTCTLCRQIKFNLSCVLPYLYAPLIMGSSELLQRPATGIPQEPDHERSQIKT